MARGWDLAAIVRRYLPNDPLSVSAIAVSVQSAPTVLPPQLIRCAAPPDTRLLRTVPEAHRLAPPLARQIHGRGTHPPALRLAR